MSGYLLGKAKRRDLQPSNKGRVDVHKLGTFTTVETSQRKIFQFFFVLRVWRGCEAN
jgi:hypothetical protein